MVFASAGRNADGILRERIRETRDPRGLMVISSDREVIAAAKAKRVRVLQAEVFAARLDLPPEATETEAGGAQLSSEEVEEWMRVFGAKRMAPFSKWDGLHSIEKPPQKPDTKEERCRR